LIGTVVDGVKGLKKRWGNEMKDDSTFLKRALSIYLGRL